MKAEPCSYSRWTWQHLAPRDAQGMGARLAIIWCVYVLSALPLLGGVQRSVDQLADGRLVIELAWSLASPPSSCLILEEHVPAGWLFQAEPDAEPTLSWRQQAQRVDLAVGVTSLPGASGSITYGLLPPPAWQGGTVLFSGTATTMVGEKQVRVPVGGADSYAALPQAPKQMQARVTGISLDRSGADGELAFAYTLWETGGSSTSTYVRSSLSGEAILYIDYRATLEPAVDWGCIYTSTPAMRIDQHDSITIPDRRGGGFYRLRVDHELSPSGLDP